MLFHRYFTYRTGTYNFLKNWTTKLFEKGRVRRRIESSFSWHTSTKDFSYFYIRKTAVFQIIKPKISAPNVSSYCLSIRYVRTYERYIDQGLFAFIEDNLWLAVRTYNGCTVNILYQQPFRHTGLTATMLRVNLFYSYYSFLIFEEHR